MYGLGSEQEAVPDHRVEPETLIPETLITDGTLINIFVNVSLTAPSGTYALVLSNRQAHGPMRPRLAGHWYQWSYRGERRNQSAASNGQV